MKIRFFLILSFIPFIVIAQLSDHHLHKSNPEKRFFNIDGTSLYDNIRLDSIVQYYSINGKERRSDYLIIEYLDNKVDRILFENLSLEFTYSEKYIDIIDIYERWGNPKNIKYTVEEGKLKIEEINRYNFSNWNTLTHRYEYSELGFLSEIESYFSWTSLTDSGGHSTSNEYLYNDNGQLDSSFYYYPDIDLIRKEAFSYDQNRLIEKRTFERESLKFLEKYDYSTFPDSIYHSISLGGDSSSLRTSEYLRLNKQGLISEAWAADNNSRVKYYYSWVQDSTTPDDLSKMELYPNPSDGCVGIKNIPSDTEALSIKIFDLSGRLLIDRAITDHNSEIRVPNLHGMFLYSIKTNVGIIKSGKVVFY